MADGSSSVQPAAPSIPSAGVSLDAKCGIVLIGHGNTASTLLEAARSIVPDCLGGVIAIDAGAGQTPELVERVCAAVESSGQSSGFALVTGLNLAMLTKLAVTDRHGELNDLAEACADSARRSVCVKIHGPEA
jgi:PTS system mannose-specific IIA component